MKKSQTATEYLIILAVVVILALIVIGVIGGIPMIGSGSSQRSTQTFLRSQGVGVMSYSLTTSGIMMEIVNNLPGSVDVINFAFYDPIVAAGITIPSDWTTCTASNLPVTLLPGERASFMCIRDLSRYAVGAKYSIPIHFEYREKATSTVHAISGPNYRLEGVVGSAVFEDTFDSGTPDEGYSS
jgi:hypothetical protein